MYNNILLNDRVAIVDGQSIFWGTKGKIIWHDDEGRATIEFDNVTEGYVQYVFHKKQLKKM